MSSGISKFYVCRRILERCVECGFCLESFECPGVGKPSIERFETACVDCGVCLLACPYEAVERIMDIIPRKHVKIIVDCQEFLVSERVTIKKALEMLGLEFGKFLDETKIFAPCKTGGCFACALLVNGTSRRVKKARATISRLLVLLMDVTCVIHNAKTTQSHTIMLLNR